MNTPLNDSILVVDDDFLIAEGLCIQVEEMGLEVCGTAASAEEAVALSQKFRPSVVLMDMRLQGVKDGVDAALAIHDTVGSKVVFITGSREAETLQRIALDHASAILFKPVADNQLQIAIRVAMSS